MPLKKIVYDFVRSCMPVYVCAYIHVYVCDFIMTSDYSLIQETQYSMENSSSGAQKIKVSKERNERNFAFLPKNFSSASTRENIEANGEEPDLDILSDE